MSDSLINAYFISNLLLWEIMTNIEDLQRRSNMWIIGIPKEEKPKQSINQYHKL